MVRFIQKPCLLCNRNIFRTLLYSSLCYIRKNKHIQNPTEHLRWSSLLRTLCNYGIFRRRIYSKHSLVQTRVCQLLLNPFHDTPLFLYLLKTSENLWFSDVFRGYRKRPLAWNGLMYQLFFRTANLLLLLYPLLLIKSMTYSLAIRFFSQSLVMRYRALNNAPHRRYLTEFWNFGYGFLVKRKENYLYIRKCNNIKNNTKKRNSGK